MIYNPIPRVIALNTPIPLLFPLLLQLLLQNILFLQALKQFSDDLKGREDFTTAEGDKEVNRKKNRYKVHNIYSFS